eukprot:GCRY01001115.1.p1 GENE.GCRY01001115.1~~GCRY01001115.1.p1  ORF type:complete len:891 (+),score=285.92 GCRY01001115.1:152-2824(+)
MNQQGIFPRTVSLMTKSRVTFVSTLVILLCVVNFGLLFFYGNKSSSDLFSPSELVSISSSPCPTLPIEVFDERYYFYDPIDIVYTWVNGSDPTLVQALADLQQTLNISAAIVSSSESNSSSAEENDQLAANRFQDNDELKYSLRSVERYAPWVRHIYLVTNGQVPHWLNLDHPRISVVTHAEIFQNTSHLPTFSSPAIESQLHHIPGLSERFLYLNDDVMFGDHIYPDDFYTPGQGQNVFLSWPVPNCAEGCPSSWIGDGYCDLACNVSECDFDFPDCVNATSNTSPSNTNSNNSWWNSWGENSNQRPVCHAGCPDSWVGDKYCDTACKHPDCGYDAGDCGLAVMQEGRLYRLAVGAGDTEILLPPGLRAAYFNFSAALPEGAVVDSAEAEHSGIVRTLTVNQKLGGIVTLTLNFDAPMQRIGLIVRAHSAAPDGEEALPPLSLNITAATVNWTVANLDDFLDANFTAVSSNTTESSNGTSPDPPTPTARTLLAFSEEEEEEESEAESLTDEQMGDFDQKLAELFAQKKLMKKEAAQARRQDVHFRFRAIGLLEVFVTAEAKNPLIFFLLPPLLNVLKSVAGKPKHMNMYERLTAFVHKITKSREAVVFSEKELCHPEDALALLEELFVLIKTAPNAEFIHIYNDCILYVAHSLLAPTPTADTDTAAALFKTALLDFMTNKTSRFSHTLFIRLFKDNRSFGLTLLPTVLQAVPHCPKEFRQTEALKLLEIALSPAKQFADKPEVAAPVLTAAVPSVLALSPKMNSARAKVVIAGLRALVQTATAAKLQMQHLQPLGDFLQAFAANTTSANLRSQANNIRALITSGPNPKTAKKLKTAAPQTTKKVQKEEEKEEMAKKATKEGRGKRPAERPVEGSPKKMKGGKKAKKERV